MPLRSNTGLYYMTPHLGPLLEEIERGLDAETLDKFRNLAEEQVPGLHFSLGLFIRNAFIYPKNSIFGRAALSALGDADGISTVVLLCLWHHVNGRPITRERFIEQLEKRFWFLENDEANAIACELLGTTGDANA